MDEQTLAGCAILVLEDEYYAASDIKRELARVGATVIGPAATLDIGLDLIASAARIDGALLDINLGGEMVFPAADALQKRGVPFLFATGYDQSMIPPQFGGVLRCEKPIGPEKLTRALATIISSGR